MSEKQKRKAAQPLPMNPDARLVSWTGKFSVSEAHELTKKILHFARGKRSLYIRAAVLNYKPKKEDFVK